MNSTRIRVGGVPEHFNLPWHLAKDQTLFAQRGLAIDWTDFKGGTGAMCKALREDEVDIAIVLTEGIIADIAKGNPSKLVGAFITSPLQWGVHVADKSNFEQVKDLENKKAAISRFGSGSHLMAYVQADQQHWNLDQLDFEVIRNLEGGLKALTEVEADYFMWEKYTTKPYVDKGLLRRVGVCPTPWPSFMIAVRVEFLENHKELTNKLIKTIYQSNYAFIQNPDSCAHISERYNLPYKDVKQWFSETEWALTPDLSPEMLNEVQAKLLDLGIIEAKVELEDLVFEF